MTSSSAHQERHSTDFMQGSAWLVSFVEAVSSSSGALSTNYTNVSISERKVKVRKVNLDHLPFRKMIDWNIDSHIVQSLFNTESLCHTIFNVLNNLSGRVYVL